MLRIILVLSALFLLSQPAQAQGDVLSAPGGRYVFGQISGYRMDQYLLDTQTGRVWQMTIGADSVLAFMPIQFDSVRVVDGEGLRFRSTAPFGNETRVYSIETPAATKAAPRQKERISFKPLFWIVSGVAAVYLLAAVAVAND